MTIELHCPVCQKLIKAPDNAGGRQGTCPYCKNRVYIPMPAQEDDGEIGIAPLDEDDLRREEELLEESAAALADLSRHQGSADDASASATPGAAGSDVPIPDQVARYVMAMSESRLDEAKLLMRDLRRVRHSAIDYVNQRLVDEMPDPIAAVPEPLAKGFLKNLLSELK